MRDYKKNPLKRGELIPEEDLRYVYITLNLDRPSTGRYFGVGETPVRRALKHYGIVKPNALGQAKAQATCLKKYGTPTPLQNKQIQRKTRKTVKAKYGVVNPFQIDSVKAKSKQTCLKRYGVEYIGQSKEIKQKALNTIKAKYGAKSLNQIKIHHLDIWNDDIKFTSLVIAGNNGDKWYTTDLAKFFNLTCSTIQAKLHELNLYKYIKYNISKAESEILEHIKSLGFSAEKKIIGNTEFDIYIDSLKLAIEYNGNWWHSTNVRPDYKYHLRKSQLAEQHGIFLYHIFEYDWLNNKTKILNQLDNLLGVNKNIIFARKCKIQHVNKDEANLFLDTNHLQGRAASKVNLGLYYKDKLVSLMTFSKSRFNKHVTWELVRFCSKAGCSVVGGASKLFKAFIAEQDPDSVVSYSDIARTRGNLYKLLGFRCSHISAPNYVWVHNTYVLSRYQCQKHVLVKQGFDKLGDTEVEIMTKRSFAQIYDCGCRTHIWEKKK